MDYLQACWWQFTWHHVDGTTERGAKFMSPYEAEYLSLLIEYKHGESCTYRRALPAQCLCETLING